MKQVDGNSNSTQTRRKALIALSGAVFTGAASTGTAYADDWPSKPVKILVISAPGGLPDNVARIVAIQLQKSLGVPVVVDNRAGAGGNIATLAVAKAVPDGYTLLITGNNHAVNPTLLPNPGFDYNKDLAPLSLLVESDMLLVAHPAFAPNNIRQLVAKAKANPGTVSMAIAPIGTPGHLGAELLAKLGGIDLNFIAYKGVGQALPDILAGRVDITIAAISSVLPQVTAGKLKAIAVSSNTRSSLVPQIPSAAEAGMPGLEVKAWLCLMGTASTPRAIVSKLNAEIVKVMAQPEMRSLMLEQGAVVRTTSPEGLGTYISKEETRWAEVLKTAKVRS